MIDLAARYGVSRMAIWKALQRSGVPTSKAVAGHVKTFCVECAAPVDHTRKVFKKAKHIFCSQECYFRWLSRHEIDHPFITRRQGLRIARKVMSQYLVLLPGYVVHHEDRNQNNNDPHNLKVFSCNADHISYRDGSGLPIWDGI